MQYCMVLHGKREYMGILEQVNNKNAWEDFYEAKIKNDSFTFSEAEKIRAFIDNERYKEYYKLITEGNFPKDFPSKRIVNKEGTKKKRIVYSYGEEDNIIFKFIAFNLYEFDDEFSRNCYAFRRGYGVRDAVKRFRGNRDFSRMYCFKADISNYFNSIDIEILLDRLAFVKEKDSGLYQLFDKILREERVYEKGQVIKESHGAMAGTPCSPFFANVYLSDVDRYFEGMRVPYFRYSDDVLIFADSEEELRRRKDIFLGEIDKHKLTINEEKVSYSKPGEGFEFLGLAYENGEIDLSANTKRKLKAKIKRKAEALRRWQRKKGLSPDKAAKGFINAMNMKFFGKDEDDFTWCRWFFPNITTDKGIKEIDEYMQKYIRYTVTGRHYKGNYKITYEQMKEWGYVNLVNEYYKY